MGHKVGDGVSKVGTGFKAAQRNSAEWITGDFKDFMIETGEKSKQAGESAVEFAREDVSEFFRNRGRDIEEAFKEVGLSMEKCWEKECLKATEVAMSCSLCYFHGTSEECAVCIDDMDVEEDSRSRKTLACNICLFHGTETECVICRDWLDMEYETD